MKRQQYDADIALELLCEDDKYITKKSEVAVAFKLHHLL